MSTKDFTTNTDVPTERKDPTSFLPEEPMSYEIKKKKKKKKRKQEDDPFKDIQEKALVTERILMPEIDPCFDPVEPEVMVKVENIEVELDYNDFTNDGDLLVPIASEDFHEPEIKIEPQYHEEGILTFQDSINEKRIQEYNGKVITTNGITCKICHLIFQSDKTLLVHQRRKHNAFRSKLKYVCATCGVAYEQKNSLAAHIRRKHGPGSKDDYKERTCDVCYLVFKGTTRLRMHMRRKHGSFADSFKHACEDCGLTYDKLCSLKVHRKRKHLTPKKPAVEQWYSCPFCPRVFNKKETYGRHVQRKHKVKDEGKPQTTEEFFESHRNEGGEVTCKQCPQICSSINHLKLHMRRKHNALLDDFKLKCRICNLSYDKIESLKKHIQRKHDKESYCNVCDKQFASRDAYLSHSHTKVIKECSICGQIFATQGTLSRHMRYKHKIDTGKVVFCKICNKGFHDYRMLTPHMLRVHYNVKYTCQVCKKEFKSKHGYKKHMLFQHQYKSDSAVKMQVCTFCLKSFADEVELCKHVNLEHTDRNMKPIVKIEKDEPQFTCTKCPEVYSTWDELKVHHRNTHYTLCSTQCQVCGDIVPENGIEKHIKKAHPKKEELSCKVCDFKTDTKSRLTQHFLRHKSVSTLHCEFNGCRYTSYYESAMQKHKKRHEEQGVRLQCAKCPFQSMNKYILKYHEEAHYTGQKRYVCDKCDYATKFPANLVQHKYKHSAEKNFKCEVCSFATKYATSLRLHVKNKHRDLPT